MTSSTTLMNVAALDAIGRVVGNVGVPAAIAFFILWQITPRLDAMNTALASSNVQLAVIGASCARPVAQLPPSPFDLVPGGR